MKILLSVYNCAPGEGSEGGIGWNSALALSAAHEVSALTQSGYRERIERELRARPAPAPIRFHYLDRPLGNAAATDARMAQANYLLWQRNAARFLRRLLDRERFDVVHHLVWGRCWMGSGILGAHGRAKLVWGPVGAIETTPLPFLRDMGVREKIRTLAVGLARRLRAARRLARRADLCIGSSPESAGYLRALGARACRTMTNSGIPEAEARRLGALPPPRDGPFRFVSLGRLLDWKGCLYAIRAFARLGETDAEYVLAGAGPARAGLEREARRLGLGGRIRFTGGISREAALDELTRGHALLHPSFHDSGGLACAEALAAGRPVICQDRGGPALQVADGCGFRVAASCAEELVAGLADRMRRYALDPALCRRHGGQAAQHAARNLTWEGKAGILTRWYRELA